MPHVAPTALPHHTRLVRGWTDAQIAGGLSPSELIGLEALEMSAGAPWGLGDLLSVGVCGGLGSAAAALEHGADGVPGAPADDALTLALEALDRLRAGRLDGVTWDGAARHGTARLDPPPVTEYSDAWVVRLRALAEVAVARLGLPEPGWAALYGLPVAEIRGFARVAYADGLLRPAVAGPGIVTAQLPAVVVELLVRTHVHWHAYVETHSPRLDATGRAKLDDMLRAGHALVAASELTLAPLPGFGTGTGEPASLRELVRAGLIAVEAVRARRARRVAEPWSDPAHLPWSSPDAPVVAARLDGLGS